ncbi:MAG: zf-HC2 domain-containing protein [Myxococcota bacterium]
MAHDREIAGIRCTQILEGLSTFLAGELPIQTQQQVRAHLSQCAWCEHFGGEFSVLIRQLRQQLAIPEPVDAGQTERLLRFLEESESPPT